MPPWARQPATSYWSATTSPAASFGVKEKCAPQPRQKPSERPGAPSRALPTGSSQRAQNRRDSATAALTSTASAGLRYGVGGISTSPAPRRLGFASLSRRGGGRRTGVAAVTDGSDPAETGVSRRRGAIPQRSQ